MHLGITSLVQCSLSNEKFKGGSKQQIWIQQKEDTPQRFKDINSNKQKLVSQTGQSQIAWDFQGETNVAVCRFRLGSNIINTAWIAKTMAAYRPTGKLGRDQSGKNEIYDEYTEANFPTPF